MTFIVIVNVIDILNGQKFSFPMNCDSGYKVKHLKHEMETVVHRLGDHRLLFIRNGTTKPFLKFYLLKKLNELQQQTTE